MAQIDDSAGIIRHYLDENNLGNFENKEFERMYKKFSRNFSPEILENLRGKSILHRIFVHDGDRNNLCYNLEFSKDYSFAGSIKGGSAFKYYLFKDKNGNWKIGPHSKPKIINENEAIEVATKIRDALVNGAKYIQNNDFKTIEDYIRLEKELNKIFSDSPVKPTNTWVHKYYCLLFPDKFLIAHNENLKEYFCNLYHLEPNNGFYAKDGQLRLLAEKSGIKFYSIFEEKIQDLFKEDINYNNLDFILDNEGKNDVESLDLKNNANIKRNIIYFGAPGTGKSFNLNQDKEELIDDENNYERVTFHPDYSYANFVGTYKPVPKADSISYEYVPGPFMRSLVKALKYPEKPFLLIIEEINRSNVAAVFGDIFQLLDRDKNNESRYSIETTEDMRKYLKSELNEVYEKIKIPSNMFIWATMNSADQGVFPMDTAFKRRWDFKYFGINYNEKLISHIKVNLNNQEISWNDLRKAINNELLSYRINEDKLLGPFFAYNEYIDEEEINEEEFKEIFKNKIIMYLFEDAAKAKRNDLFAGARENNNVIYSRVCELFDAKGIEIFCDNIKEALLKSDLESEIEEDLIEEVFEESE